jgi:hypothetical protein
MKFIGEMNFRLLTYLAELLDNRTDEAMQGSLRLRRHTNLILIPVPFVTGCI